MTRPQPSGALAGHLAKAREILARAGVPSPGADAEILAGQVLGVGRGTVTMLSLRGEVLPEDRALALAELVEQRANRVPLQHLTGTAPFRGVTLRVGPGVFVPRPETEVTAGLAIDEASALAARGVRPLVVDLCTGSGAIALAVAHEVPSARIVALELHEQALAWAEMNLRAADVASSCVTGSGGEADVRPARVALRAGDVVSCDTEVLSDLVGQVDVVVSNPPYIPSDAVPVDPEVRDHDPASALYGGGPDGLRLPGAVVTAAGALLRDGGLLVMEHGDGQGRSTRALAADGTWQDARTVPDLAGRDRVLVVRRRDPSARVRDSCP